MGNLKQNSISAYPSKISLSTLKVPLNISGFYQNRDYFKLAFLRILRFLVKKTRLNQEKKATFPGTF